MLLSRNNGQKKEEFEVYERDKEDKFSQFNISFESCMVMEIHPLHIYTTQ